MEDGKKRESEGNGAENPIKGAVTGENGLFSTVHK